MCWQLVVKECANKGGREVLVNSFSDCLDEKARRRAKQLGLLSSHGKGRWARYSLTDLGKQYVSGAVTFAYPYVASGIRGRAKGSHLQPVFKGALNV
jgi:hypothetical protein